MSTRTPGVQPRNEFGRDWGNYTVPNDLPNAAFSAITANELAPLEIGDTAFVSGGGLYVCTFPGTFGLLDAIWLSTGVGGLPISDRRDHSVNGSFIEYWNMTLPIMRWKTNVNPVGGYTGTGTGNKAILGHWLSAPMPLSALTTLEFSVQQLTPEAGVNGNTIPYVNLVVELEPVGLHAGVYTIFSMMSRDFPTLNLGAFVDAAPFYTVTWNAALHNAQVVSDRGLYRLSPPLPVWDPPFPPAGPPGQFIVPAAFIAPSVGGNPPVGNWTQRSYTMASILAFYPAARIINVNSLDGGLPRLTITAGVLMSAGDSINVRQNAVRVLAWKMNGIAI